MKMYKKADTPRRPDTGGIEGGGGCGGGGGWVGMCSNYETLKSDHYHVTGYVCFIQA